MRNKSVLIGAVAVLLVILIGLAAPLMGTMDPKAIDPAWRNKVPGTEQATVGPDGVERKFTYWMGTDSLGRDVYSRVVYGARISIVVGVAVAAISTVIGLFFGLVAGYVRWIDAIVMRIMDGLMAIPPIRSPSASWRCGVRASALSSLPSWCRRFPALCGSSAPSCSPSARSLT